MRLCVSLSVPLPVRTIIPKLPGRSQRNFAKSTIDYVHAVIFLKKKKTPVELLRPQFISDFLKKNASE